MIKYKLKGIIVNFTIVSINKFFGLENTGTRSVTSSRIKLKSNNNPSHISKYGLNTIPTEGNIIPPAIESKIAMDRRKKVSLLEFSFTIIISGFSGMKQYIAYWRLSCFFCKRYLKDTPAKLAQYAFS
jgi:hypothetical protein